MAASSPHIVRSRTLRGKEETVTTTDQAPQLCCTNDLKGFILRLHCGSWGHEQTGKRGRQPDYSDAAIQTCLPMKVLFGMALRQTTGFVESLLRLIGLDWAEPDLSTLSRRQKTLKVNIAYRGSHGPFHLLVDSTGIKVEGARRWSPCEARGRVAGPVQRKARSVRTSAA